MTPRKILILCALALCLALPQALHARDTEVHLSISKKVNAKVKILVPPIRELRSRPDQDSGLMKKILKDMELSGVLVPLHQGEMIREAEEADRRQDRVLLANWGRFGADALLKINDNSLVGISDFETSVYSIQTQQRLMAKRYKGAASGQKKLVHAMINDVVLALTGNTGIALTKLAFINDSTGNKELYVMDYDGDNLRRISSDRSLMLYPRWSPDGKDLVAVSYLRSKPNICRIDVARGTRSFISSFPGLNAGAAYSPDGKSLALTLSKDGNPEIYVLHLGSDRTQRLTKNKAVDSSPAWSPDGRQIAFVSDRGGSPQIYIMDADGGNTRRISRQGGYNTSPAWSPKGDLIAYCTLIGKNFQIYVLDASSGIAYPVTGDDRSNEDPSWAPDGRHLVYSGSKNYLSNLFMIDIFDQHPIQLTNRIGNCISPSWSKNFS